MGTQEQVRISVKGALVPGVEKGSVGTCLLADLGSEGLVWCWVTQFWVGAGVAGVSFIGGGQEAEVVLCSDGVRGGTASSGCARGALFLSSGGRARDVPSVAAKLACTGEGPVVPGTGSSDKAEVSLSGQSGAW